MSNEPNNQNQQNTDGDVQQIYTLIGKLICNFFSNSKILDLLKVQPIIGNFIVASLVTFTGFSIFENNNSKIIDAHSMCEQIKGEVASQLNIDSSKIIDFSPGTTSSNIEKQLFSCHYNIQEEAENRLGNSNPATKRYYIVYQVLRDEFVASIKEEKITEDALKEICRDETIYTRELLAKKQYNPDEHKIIEEGLELQADPQNTVYPAFRWKCKYKVVPQNYQPQEKPGSQFPSIYVGLDLDAYCKKNFGEEDLTKARYHYYNDPDSLYCVNPNF
jgi:hypothetical protein